jgi:hypothetical protein
MMEYRSVLLVSQRVLSDSRAERICWFVVRADDEVEGGGIVKGVR